MDANVKVNGIAKIAGKILGISAAKKNAVPAPIMTDAACISRQHYKERMREDCLTLGLCILTLGVLFYSYTSVSSLWLP